jgi:hypothetical protein
MPPKIVRAAENNPLFSVVFTGRQKSPAIFDD